MTPEREHNQISFDEIASNAKEHLLESGEHLPALILEASNDIFVGEIPDVPGTHGDRMELMRLLGESAANGGKVGQLSQVFMISEGWMSMGAKDKPAVMSPSEDPNRKEVLIVSSINILEDMKRIELFEIFRDENKKVIDLTRLLPDEDKKDESVKIPLLETFVQSFRIAYQAKNN